jgi:hypothetical protein
MVADGIRLRGYGDWVAIESTADAAAVAACRDVLRTIAGEHTMWRFNNLGEGESLGAFRRDYEQHVERDIGWILRLARPLPQQAGA